MQAALVIGCRYSSLIQDLSHKQTGQFLVNNTIMGTTDLALTLRRKPCSIALTQRHALQNVRRGIQVKIYRRITNIVCSFVCDLSNIIDRAQTEDPFDVFATVNMQSLILARWHRVIWYTVTNVSLLR